jgi:hypothetical protein
MNAQVETWRSKGARGRTPRRVTDLRDRAWARGHV